MKSNTLFKCISLSILIVFYFQQNSFAQSPDTSLINQYLREIQSTKDFNKKLSIIEEAIQVFREKNDHPTVAGFYREKGIIHFNLKQGNIDSARVAYETAFQISETLKDTFSMGRALAMIGSIDGEKYHFESAEKKTKEAIAFFESIGNSKQVESAQNSLGIIYQNQGLLRQAKEIYLKVYEKSKLNKNVLNQARVLSNLGLNAKNLGEFKESAKYLKESEKIIDTLTKGKPHRGKVFIYNSLANLYRTIGLYDFSVEYAQKCKAMSDSVGYSYGEKMFLVLMGSNFLKQKQFGEAKPYFDSLLAYSEKQSINPSDLAVAYSNLGAFYMQSENFEEAKKWLLKVIEIHEAGNQKPSLAGNYQLLGELYGTNKQTEKAIEYIQKSAKLAKEVGDRRQPIIEYGSMGHVYMKAGQYQKAIPLFLRAEKTADSLGMKPTLKELYDYLSKSYEEIGDYKKAMKYHIKLLDAENILKNERVAIALAEKNAAYKLEEISDDLEESRSAELLAKMEKEEQQAKNKRNLELAGLVISLLLLLLYHFSKMASNRKKQNQTLENYNVNLEDKNQHLELQKRLIVGQKNIMERNNLALTEELSVVSSDLEKIHLVQNALIHLNNKKTIKPLSIYYIQLCYFSTK